MIKMITIKGTHCHACKALIEEVCLERQGVQSCDVDFKTGKTTIEHDSSFDLASATAEIESLGEYKIIL